MSRGTSGSLFEGDVACAAFDFNVDMSGSLLDRGDVAVAGAALDRLYVVCGVLGQAPVRRRGVPSIALRAAKGRLVL